MNAIGIVALVTFFLASLGAPLSYLLLNLWGIGKQFSDRPMAIWSDREARGKFLVFVGFCALGVLSGAVGFVFGDWPQN